MKSKKSILSLLFLLFVFPLIAQDAGQVEMADKMRSDGKIYVVVAVMLIIFSVLALFLFFMDRKIGKMENMLKEKTNKQITR